MDINRHDMFSSRYESVPSNLVRLCSFHIPCTWSTLSEKMSADVCDKARRWSAMIYAFLIIGRQQRDFYKVMSFGKKGKNATR